MADVVLLPVDDPIPGSWDAILVGGQVIHNVHAPGSCLGGSCCIHKPSDHHMRDWPMNWRQDRRLMERICEHGVGHPDPDDINPDGVHGCDGCCYGAYPPRERPL